MATFKVGQRVRVIQSVQGLEGMEAVITAIPGVCCVHVKTECDIHVEGRPSWVPSGDWGSRLSSLAPLTDPGEEAWAADAVRKVTKPEPVAPKVPDKTYAQYFDAIWKELRS